VVTLVGANTHINVLRVSDRVMLLVLSLAENGPYGIVTSNTHDLKWKRPIWGLDDWC